MNLLRKSTKNHTLARVKCQVLGHDDNFVFAKSGYTSVEPVCKFCGQKFETPYEYTRSRRDTLSGLLQEAKRRHLTKHPKDITIEYSRGR